MARSGRQAFRFLLTSDLRVCCLLGCCRFATSVSLYAELCRFRRLGSASLPAAELVGTGIDETYSMDCGSRGPGERRLQ